MHLVETYSLSTGSKIKKPFIHKKFFPLPFDKYITIQNSSGMQGKCYDYFQEVVNFVYEDLGKFWLQNNSNWGQGEDKALNNVFHLQGQTNINQTAFILENSKLHIGNDSFAIHMCSAFDVPLIGLYSVSSPEIAGPFWKNKNQICLTPKNWNPSFNPNESPKRVNEIKIESIIESIQTLLNINLSQNIHTIFIGERYGHILLEAIPSIILPNTVFPEVPLNIRFDYIDKIEEKDYICTLNNLNTRKCAIITDKPLEIEKLFQLKDKIINLFYDITFNDIDLNFVNKIKSLGMKIDFIFNKSKNKNESVLNNKKLELIDYQEIINIVENTDKPTEEIRESKFYKSKKILFANNNTYLSKAAYLENKPVNLDKLDVIQNIKDINNIDLLIEEDADYCLFYK
jgi:hypothetical protein